MRKDANLKSVKKSSMLYFQLGLIATMVIVLFVLEFQFKNSLKVQKTFTFTPTDDVFNTNYTIIEHVKTTVKQDKVLKPVSKLKTDFTKVKIENNNVVIEEPKLQSNDNYIIEDTNNGNITSNENKSVSKPINEEITIFNVTQLPLFPECVGVAEENQKDCFDEQMMKAIVRNLKYPSKELEEGKQGTALIEFIIDENGKIVNVNPLNNNRATKGMQDAAVKAVNKLPKLIPAKYGNENVKVKYTVPISFQIK